MKKAALFDLLILSAVFWSAWALRFAGVSNIGAITMAAGGAVGAFLMLRRKITLEAVGLRPLRWRDFARSFEALGVIGVNYLIVAPILISLLGPLQTSSALSEQPQNLSEFLLDIVLFTWIAAAFGEEFFFRGMVLSRFRTLFGGGVAAGFVAALAQAVWFGAGHASQGITGIVLTGAIGFSLAIYFLTRAEKSLTPLIIAHAAANTMTLTFAYFS